MHHESLLANRLFLVAALVLMSLDGYVAGPNQSVTNPLGDGGESLHEWAFAVQTFRTMHGMEGGTTGPDDEIAAEGVRNIGATIMGRHMFGGGEGPWGDNPWTTFHSAASRPRTSALGSSTRPRPATTNIAGSTDAPRLVDM